MIGAISLLSRFIFEIIFIMYQPQQIMSIGSYQKKKKKKNYVYRYEKNYVSKLINWTHDLTLEY